MTFREIVDLIAQMGPGDPKVAEVPPKELIAFFVRGSRCLRQWKQQTLASFAAVSLSTVERVERAEPVSDLKLDQIAVALGYEPGYLTGPRFPKPQEEAISAFLEQWGNFEPVPVKRLDIDSQIRRLANCHGFLLYRADIDAREGAEVLVAELGEWFELASFLIGCPDLAGSTEGRRRKLYGDIRACVRKLETNGFFVLGGVMEAPQPEIADWKIAVVAISSRRTDPGAGKRRYVLVDRRCAALPENPPNGAAQAMMEE